MSKSKRVVVHLGQKDTDLLAWVHKVPERMLPTLVRIALAHHINNKPLSLGTVYIDKAKLPPKSLNLIFTKSVDPELYEWARQLPKGLASATIKNVLREYIDFTANPEDESLNLLIAPTVIKTPSALPKEDLLPEEDYLEEYLEDEIDSIMGASITPK